VSDLSHAVDTVLVRCLDVKGGEEVVVVTDPGLLPVAEALVRGARELGAEVVLAEMSERDNNGVEPPDTIAAALLACDVFIAPTSKSLSHTEARRAASEKGARGATMPTITEDLLVRTMGADYAAVKKRSLRVAELLTGGSEVRITTHAGTDVTMAIEGRSGLADTGDLTARGAFGNLPAGEGFIAPLEGRTNGVVVFDGLVGEDPMEVDITDGYALSVSTSGEEWRRRAERYGRDAFAVAELGIGTNDSASLTGNVLEDEKIMGTIHIAFGDNHSFGGTVRVPSHQDFVVLNPTLTIDQKVLLEDGRLLL
jgi:leucyl aminopeptidase (aminopeptidase T)